MRQYIRRRRVPWGGRKARDTPTPLLGVSQGSQAKQLQHICRRPISDPCWLPDGYLSLCDPLWALLSWFYGPSSCGVLGFSGSYNLFPPIPRGSCRKLCLIFGCSHIIFLLMSITMVMMCPLRRFILHFIGVSCVYASSAEVRNAHQIPWNWSYKWLWISGYRCCELNLVLRKNSKLLRAKYHSSPKMYLLMRHNFILIVNGSNVTSQPMFYLSYCFGWNQE